MAATAAVSPSEYLQPAASTAQVSRGVSVGSSSSPGRRDASWGAGQQTPHPSAPPASAVASVAASGVGLVVGRVGEPRSGLVPSPDASSSGEVFLLPVLCFPEGSLGMG